MKKILISALVVLLILSVSVVAYAEDVFSDNKIEVTCNARVDSAAVGDGVYFDFVVKNITDDYIVYVESIHDVQSGKSLFCNTEILPNTQESGIVFYAILEETNFDLDYNFNVNYSYASVTENNTQNIDDIDLTSILINTREIGFVAVSDTVALATETPTPTPTPSDDGLVFESNYCDFDIAVSSTIVPSFGDQSRYSLEKLCDNDLATYWIPENRNGVGESISFTFENGKRAKIKSLKIYGGSGKSYTSYFTNNRAKDISIYLDGVLKGALTLNDVQSYQNIFFIDEPVASEVSIVFDSIYPSSQYDGHTEWDDLTISEVIINANLEVE